MNRNYPPPTAGQWFALIALYLLTSIGLMALLSLGHQQLQEQPSQASETEEPPSR